MVMLAVFARAAYGKHFIILIHLLTERVARVGHYTREPGGPFIFIVSLLCSIKWTDGLHQTLLGMQIQI